MDHPKFELIELEGFDVESMKFLDETHDRCEVVLQWIQRLVVEANAAEVIKIAPPILSRVYNQLGNGIVNLNNARKISDFPIPFPLAQMLSMMLMVHWFTIAVIAAAGIKHAFWATSLPFIAQLAYWSVNYIAVELENPFGDDPNDLPLQDMQRDLNKSLKGLLHPLALFHPQFTLNSETRNLRLIDCDFDTYVKEASFSDRRQRMLKRKGARKFKKAALAEAPREVSRSAQEEDPQWISRPASRDESFKESDQWIRQGTGSLELNGVDDNIRHVTSTDETNCKNEDTIEVQLNRELVRVTNSMEGHLARVVQELRD
eukprot:CAMPEP_0169179514 /NCGR_PEP_ID=MMETSP1015-20121227/67674_1 /TAXON_ID=342587 /ORGANISM="Karlodinium micrum, Strain CCMP2283" /LENGTH=316 /DNA_ID=CAMNT_0009254553 /DNA_START=135 /DNA_END=1082 /DNA_ORIENTATION=+